MIEAKFLVGCLCVTIDNRIAYKFIVLLNINYNLNFIFIEFNNNVRPNIGQHHSHHEQI